MRSRERIFDSAPVYNQARIKFAETRCQEVFPTVPTLAFYKPYGVLSAFTDRDGGPTLAPYIPVPDVYAMGRLDKDSEGLLLLSDDGELAHLVTHPRHHLPKVYLAQVERIPGEAALDALRRGVSVKGAVTRPARAELLDAEPDLPLRDPPIRYRETVPTAWLRLTLREGRNRQVRRMTAAVGHPTLRLVRVAIGPIRLEPLGVGEWRELAPGEVHALREAAS